MSVCQVSAMEFSRLHIKYPTGALFNRFVTINYQFCIQIHKVAVINMAIVMWIYILQNLLNKICKSCR